METITHKQGATFQWLFNVVDLLPGEDLVGSVGRSEVRTQCRELVEALTFTWLTDGTQFTIVSPTNTVDWPTGGLVFDVKFYLTGNQSIATDTGIINVSAGVTQ